MDILQAIILGIIQGITEFLPISSSGHLVLLERFWAIDDGVLFLNVVLHIATLLAVVIFYRKRLCGMIKQPFCVENRFLVVATIPTVLIVLIFNNFFENAFSGGLLVLGFLLTAGILIATEKFSRYYEKKRIPYQNINYKNALLLGVFQGLAVMPGLSRSGTTLCAGIIMGIDKKQAIDFSFLMSIPIILASMVYECFKVDWTSTIANLDIVAIIISCVFAFAFAILGIKLMLKVVQKVQYYWFALYLVVLSIVTLWLI